MAINPLAIGGGVVAAAAVVGGGLYAGGVFGGGNSVNQQGSGNVAPKKAVLATGDYLFNDEEFKKAEGQYKDKWGKDYGRYLVDSKKNTKWWSESYEKFKKDHKETAKTDKFKTVTESGTTSLSSICNEAYKAEKANVKDTGADETNFNEDNVWKYCSPLGQKPTTIEGKQEAGNYNGKIGGGTHKGKLVSVTDTNNDEFWKIKEDEFFDATSTLKGSDADSGKLFKNYYDTENTKEKGKRKTLKEVCKEAYEQTTTGGTSNPTETEVLKYCSLTGK